MWTYPVTVRTQRATTCAQVSPESALAALLSALGVGSGFDPTLLGHGLLVKGAAEVLSRSLLNYDEVSTFVS